MHIDDDIDSSAYEESIINTENEWNIDDVIRNVSDDFIVIEEKEWNLYIDSCFSHDDIIQMISTRIIISQCQVMGSILLSTIVTSTDCVRMMNHNLKKTTSHTTTVSAELGKNLTEMNSLF